jgi:hypothetical protein
MILSAPQQADSPCWRRSWRPKRWKRIDQVSVPAVKGHGQPGPDKAELEKLPKAKLIAMILKQREDTRIRLEEDDQQLAQLREQLAKLQGKLNTHQTGQKIKAIN